MNWKWVYDGFEPAREKLRETLCTLGNGYFAIRGAAPESDADEVHYPATYLAGGYDRAVTTLDGQTLENEDLVNFPGGLSLKFRAVGEGWVTLSEEGLLSYRQVLDLREGVLVREARFRLGQGRTLKMHQRKMVHMRRPHLAVLETSLEAENFDGEIVVRSCIDGRLCNAGVARYRDLNAQHLLPVSSQRVDGEVHYLEVRTRQSQLHVGQAARLRLFQDGRPLPVACTPLQEPLLSGVECVVPLRAQKALTIEKTLALVSSRDHALADCRTTALRELSRADDVPSLWTQQRTFWSHLWSRFDMRLQVADELSAVEIDRTLRLHIFHLLQTVSPNTMELDVGVPARGLHGEAYRGHVFWDELFLFPFLNWRMPEITRALLRYRFRRLDEARARAREAGFRGALYPWQSGSDGREESQQLHLNPLSGRWVADHTFLQRHVNSAIAYNLWQYFQVTRDMEFFSYAGAEMLLEIARFWASLAKKDPRTGRYTISGVMGPDEYHDRLPDSKTPGLANNTYTNVMAVWVLLRAREALQLLPPERSRELMELLHLSAEECALWDDITRRMTVVFHADGLISPFEGYEGLEELNWSAYRERYGDIQRLDRLLEAEGDSPHRYKVSKQADVLMLFYLFSKRELAELFFRLGYTLTSEAIEKNIAYYLQRTSHGSSLSRVVHAWVMARSNVSASWQFFQEALKSDVADTQKGTTPEGIHLGAMAGTVDLVQRGYTGIVTEGEVLSFDPNLPGPVECLHLKLHYRGHALTVHLTQKELKVDAAWGCPEPIRIAFRGQTFALQQGKGLSFLL